MRIRVEDDFLVAAYLDAKDDVIAAGFEWEVAWQESRCRVPLVASRVLSEYSWVVLCSGFRESVVRRAFPLLAEAFCNWNPARLTKRRRECLSAAKTVFANVAKLAAIADFAMYLSNRGIGEIQTHLAQLDTEWFTRFPFIGPITCRHLMKNLGAPLAKPDRHLVRLAQTCGDDGGDVQALCQKIGLAVGDLPQVVDIVLWRYATLEPAYLARFSRRAS